MVLRSRFRYFSCRFGESQIARQRRRYIPPETSILTRLMLLGPFESAIHCALRKHAEDLRALESTLLDIAELPVHDETVRTCTELGEILSSLHAMLREHVAQLDRVILATREEVIPEVDASRVLSKRSARPFETPIHDASSFVCEYYTQLNRVAFAYTMLHARSMALHDSSTTKVALEHLKDLTRFIRALSEVAPKVAVQEVSRHFGGLVPHAAESALRHTQEAWNQPSLFVAVL